MRAQAAAAPRSTRRARPFAAAGSEAVRRALTPEIEAELSAIALAAGCELIHVEWKGGVLRLVLDRPTGAVPPGARAAAAGEQLGAPAGQLAEVGEPSAPASASGGHAVTAEGPSGVSLADCEHVAKQASALLDVLDFGEGRYLLEVSSPGLDRQLYGPRDYQRFVGRLARVSYEAAGTCRTVVGRLAGFRQPAAGGAAAAPPPGSGEVSLVDERTGERLAVALDSIRLARLEVEL
jgi:ribosome maturation factor RimP